MLKHHRHQALLLETRQVFILLALAKSMLRYRKPRARLRPYKLRSRLIHRQDLEVMLLLELRRDLHLLAEDLHRGHILEMLVPVEDEAAAISLPASTAHLPKQALRVVDVVLRDKTAQALLPICLRHRRRQGALHHRTMDRVQMDSHLMTYLGLPTPMMCLLVADRLHRATRITEETAEANWPRIAGLNDEHRGIRVGMMNHAGIENTEVIEMVARARTRDTEGQIRRGGKRDRVGAKTSHQRLMRGGEGMHDPVLETKRSHRESTAAMMRRVRMVEVLVPEEEEEEEVVVVVVVVVVEEEAQESQAKSECDVACESEWSERENRTMASSTCGRRHEAQCCISWTGDALQMLFHREAF